MLPLPENPCTYMPWHLIHCKPRREAYAANTLRALLHLTVFLPENQVRWQGKIRSIPFFPGYLFVRADLQQIPVSHINACPGVVRLVQFGGDPLPIPDYVIEAISQQLEILNAKAYSSSYHNFHPGDTVRMKHGPMQDLEMIFLGPTTHTTRVNVLLQLLGRLKEVHVEADALEKLNKQSQPLPQIHMKRERFTRGKGRKIKHSA